MKKIFFIISLLFAVLGNAQEPEKEVSLQDIAKKQEVKLNAFSLIAFTSLDVTYEYLLSNESSFGVALFYNLNDINDDLYFPKKFSLTPYFRWFFSENKLARGFFVEGFGSLNSYEDQKSNVTSNIPENVSETDFALGISVGGKFVLKSGFIAEIYLGVGRNLVNNSNDNFKNPLITRGGISLGYRF